MLEATYTTTMARLLLLLQLIYFGWSGWSLLLLLLPQVQALTVTERRRCILRPWGGGGKSDDTAAAAAADKQPASLGWALEERTTVTDETTTTTTAQRTSGSWKMTVAWSGESEVTIQLPWNGGDDDDKDTNDAVPTDDLATTLWDAGVAGAILCRSPGFIEYLGKNKTVLELGSGIGLPGWVAGASAASATLTDHDQRAVVRIGNMAAKNPGHNITARFLEWKDDHSNADPFDVILATDVAYYFYLLRPLMDTVKAYLRDTVLIMGQANRQSQWDLYDNLRLGCYNQLTDDREGPWPGQTRMLLYNLQVNQWVKETDADGVMVEEEKIGSVMPIAVIHHEAEPNSEQTTDHFYSAWDHVATTEDRDSIRISF